jgi:hypothetical protein
MSRPPTTGGILSETVRGKPSPSGSGRKRKAGRPAGRAVAAHLRCACLHIGAAVSRCAAPLVSGGPMPRADARGSLSPPCDRPRRPPCLSFPSRTQTTRASRAASDRARRSAKSG